MPHIVAYFRQSDEEGHKKELSIPYQEERFRADIERRRAAGEEIEFEMAPPDKGRSGGELDRPGLQWVLSNLDRFDEVWVLDHDRLARHDFYAPLIMRELRSRGIRLWCSTGGADETTPMGRFLTDLRLRYGALFREEVSARTKANRDHRLREGLWMNHAPTGYKFADEGGQGSRRVLVPDPEAAPKVQELFTLMAGGLSQKKACARLGLNASTVIWQRDNPLYIGLVYKHREKVQALPDQTYAGLWAMAYDPSCDVLYPGRHEPLVDAETWDALQRRLQSGTRRRVSERLALSGRFRCGLCGSVLRIRRNPGKRAPGLRCDTCGWERSYRYAEWTILAALGALAVSPKFDEAVERYLAAQQKQDDKTSEAMAQLQQERDMAQVQLERALDALLETDEASPAIRARVGRLQTTVTDLESQIAVMQAAERSRLSVVTTWRDAHRQLLDLDLWTLWRTATPAEQRDLLTNVFSAIRATPEHVTFAVRGFDVGFEFGIELEWQTEGMSPFVEVAGPRIKLLGDILPPFRVVDFAACSRAAAGTPRGR